MGSIGWGPNGPPRNRRRRMGLDRADLEQWEDPRVFAHAKSQYETWVARGVLDPDQPTLYGHLLYQRQTIGEFTPVERAMIRAALGRSEEP